MNLFNLTKIFFFLNANMLKILFKKMYNVSRFFVCINKYKNCICMLQKSKPKLHMEYLERSYHKHITNTSILPYEVTCGSKKVLQRSDLIRPCRLYINANLLTKHIRTMIYLRINVYTYTYTYLYGTYTHIHNLIPLDARIYNNN